MPKSTRLAAAQVLATVGFLSNVANVVGVGSYSGVLILFPILFLVALVTSTMSFFVARRKGSRLISSLLILSGLIGIGLFIHVTIGIVIGALVLTMGLVKTWITVRQRGTMVATSTGTTTGGDRAAKAMATMMIIMIMR
jgi:hypothetical protein